MDIGRKIYYELSTGNVIVDTGERSGDVVGTTEAQDFQLYTALQPYQQSAVGVLQLSYGEDASNFQAGYTYHVDITQSPPVIAWDTTGTLAQAQQQKYVQLENSLQEQYAQGFSSSAVNSTAITWPFDQASQIKWNYLLGVVASGIFPSTGVQVKDLTENTYTITDPTVAKNLCTDAMNFYLQWDSHYHTLYDDVKNATTVSGVNAVQW